ncbi:MAG TPA: hypothetical protein VIQ05_25320, partial [Tardiphaga sp.]
MGATGSKPRHYKPSLPCGGTAKRRPLCACGQPFPSYDRPTKRRTSALIDDHRENAMNVTQGLRRVLQTNPLGIATVDGDRRRS